MNDGQCRVAYFQVQPEGLELFFRSEALLFAYAAGLHFTLAALLDEKKQPRHCLLDEC